MTPFYSVAVIFSKDKKKILLGKRREDKLWTSPAGGGEEGESPKACIIRELFEEANICCKENDLKFLTSMTAKNGKPIFIFTTCMDGKQNIHVKNDPDKEVPSWNWYPLDAMPKLEENRLKTVNMAKMKMNDLLKSIVSTDMHSGVDLHTEDFSQDDMAARSSDWYSKIMSLMEDSEVNEPETIELENGFEMSIQRIHEGLYSGSIKDGNQDRVLNFAELSIPSLVQTLKAKEFIEKDSKIEETQDVDSPPEGDSDVQVQAPGLESLRNLMDTLKNVHIEGDLNISIQKSIKNLIQRLEKAEPKRGKRGFPIGTQRTWSNGIQAVKHADGWVVIGGKHHGKLVGNFKEEAKEHHLDVANDHNVENTDKEVKDIEAQIAQLKAAHEAEQKKLKEDHAKLVADLKAKHEAASKKVGAQLEEKEKGTKKESENSKEREGSDKKEKETGAEGSPKDKDTSGEKNDKQGAGNDSEPTGPSGDSSTEDEESDVEGETEESPREEAEGFLDSKGEYENARESKVSNLGEDLIDSARHKRAWSTAAEAEATGQAKKVVMRGKMLKENPVQLAGASNPIKAAFLYQVMQSFPLGPDYKSLEQSEYKKLANDFDSASERNKRTFANTEFPIKNEVDARKEYIEAYDKIKAEVERLNRDSSLDMTQTQDALYNFLGDYRRELNGTEGSGYTSKDKRYSLVARQLHKLQTKDVGRVTAFGNRSKARAKVAQVMKDATPEQTEDIMDKLMAGSAKGQPLQKLMGVKTDSKGKKTYEIKGPAQFYVTDRVSRKGPETNLSKMVEAQKALTPEGDFQMRGVQYGNSVTDEERVHHTTKLAESLQDLTDILGIPKEMASFNGRLGMAIGARGKGGAMAHYEPGTKVINLTRKNGVGTLAHEWGHFMDNVLAQVNGSNSGYLSEIYSGGSDSKSEKAMAAFKGSESWKQYKKEVREEASQLIKNGQMSPGKYKYWMSDRECFARAFEAHVQHKLESAGRENTYLSSAPKEGKLWPNNDMRSKLGPEFDKLMEGIKSSGDLKKAMDIMRLTRLIDSFGSQNN